MSRNNLTDECKNRYTTTYDLTPVGGCQAHSQMGVLWHVPTFRAWIATTSPHSCVEARVGRPNGCYDLTDVAALVLPSTLARCAALAAALQTRWACPWTTRPPSRCGPRATPRRRTTCSLATFQELDGRQKVLRFRAGRKRRPPAGMTRRLLLAALGGSTPQRERTARTVAAFRHLGALRRIATLSRPDSRRQSTAAPSYRSGSTESRPRTSESRSTCIREGASHSFGACRIKSATNEVEQWVPCIRTSGVFALRWAP